MKSLLLRWLYDLSLTPPPLPTPHTPNTAAPTLCNDVLSTSWKGEGSIRISSISIGLSISASSHALIYGERMGSKVTGMSGGEEGGRREAGSDRGED